MRAGGTPTGPSVRLAKRAPRALLVEPDARFASLLDAYLSSRGWAVQRVDEPRDALARIEALRPDVVVVELVGPEPTGLHFAGLVALLPSPPPVVICTRLVAPQSWKRAALQQLGVHALVTRPAPFGDIERVFAKCVATHTGAALEGATVGATP